MLTSQALEPKYAGIVGKCFFLIYILGETIMANLCKPRIRCPQSKAPNLWPRLCHNVIPHCRLGLLLNKRIVRILTEHLDYYFVCLHTVFSGGGSTYGILWGKKSLSSRENCECDHSATGKRDYKPHQSFYLIRQLFYLKVHGPIGDFSFK